MTDRDTPIRLNGEWLVLGTILPTTPTLCAEVSIAGCVIDKETRLPIQGARVTVESQDKAFREWRRLKRLAHGDRWNDLLERPDQTWSRADGHFHFLDLPEGTYTLTASLPRAGARYGIAEIGNVKVPPVSADTAGASDIYPQDAYQKLELPSTAIKGTVTFQEAQGSGKTKCVPVFMAEVKIQGARERILTDIDGKYLLAGLEWHKDGKYTVTVAARGYQHEQEELTVRKYDAEERNFILKPQKQERKEHI